MLILEYAHSDNPCSNIAILEYFQKFLWNISIYWIISIFLVGIFPSYEF